MYLDLFTAINRVIDSLQESQLRTEEMYITADEPVLRLVCEKTSEPEEANDKVAPALKYSKEIIGLNILTKRGEHSVSRDELAKAINKTPAYIELVERGQRELTVEELCLVSNFFSTHLEELIQPQPVKLGVRRV